MSKEYYKKKIIDLRAKIEKEHRITLRYDGKEVEEDLDAYGCSNGDFGQEWYMYDDED
ncbi:MAG: hypothetical protein IJ377_04975 [Rikenellaceae bacterium]|nr:hypothetical protein [Rikenellaceae bacterium]